jgi:hypothetical protein
MPNAKSAAFFNALNLSDDLKQRGGRPDLN